MLNQLLPLLCFIGGCLTAGLSIFFIMYHARKIDGKLLVYLESQISERDSRIYRLTALKELKVTLPELTDEELQANLQQGRAMFRDDYTEAEIAAQRNRV